METDASVLTTVWANFESKVQEVFRLGYQLTVISQWEGVQVVEDHLNTWKEKLTQQNTNTTTVLKQEAEQDQQVDHGQPTDPGNHVVVASNTMDVQPDTVKDSQFSLSPAGHADQESAKNDDSMGLDSECLDPDPADQSCTIQTATPIKSSRCRPRRTKSNTQKPRTRKVTQEEKKVKSAKVKLKSVKKTKKSIVSKEEKEEILSDKNQDEKLSSNKDELKQKSVKKNTSGTRRPKRGMRDGLTYHPYTQKTDQTVVKDAKATKKKQGRPHKTDYSFDLNDLIQPSGQAKPYTCDECGKQYSQKESLKTHKRIIHQYGGLKCSECEKVFFSYGSLSHHRKLVHRGEGYECHICGHKAAEQEWLNRHMGVHGLSPGHVKRMLCDLCGKNFHTRERLKSHVVAVHLQKREFCCDQCDHKTFSQSLLDTHKRNIHESSNQTHMCDICGVALKYKSSLTEHKRIHNIKETFECAQCQISFKTKKRLNSHLKTHAERQHQCGTCMKKFVTKDMLRRHTRIHTGEKDYCCPYCNYTSSFGCNVRKHCFKVHKQQYKIPTRKEIRERKAYVNMIPESNHPPQAMSVQELTTVDPSHLLSLGQVSHDDKAAYDQSLTMHSVAPVAVQSDTMNTVTYVDNGAVVVGHGQNVAEFPMFFTGDVQIEVIPNEPH